MRNRHAVKRFGAENVIRYGSEGLVFEQGYVLEGGRMEDEARAMDRKNFFEQLSIVRVAEVTGGRM